MTLLTAGGCGSEPDSRDVASAKGNGTSAAGNIDKTERERRWMECMNAAGATVYRTDEGQFSVDKDKTPGDKAQAAEEKCRSLYPAAIATTAPPLTAQALERLRKHAACMREHGIPEYPDPDPVSGEENASAVISKRGKTDPQLRAALEACENLPGGTSTEPGVPGA